MNSTPPTPATCPYSRFEIRPVKIDGENYTRATDADADAWGLYGIGPDDLPAHIEDFPSRASAENAASRLLPPARDVSGYTKAGPNGVNADPAAIVAIIISLHEASKLHLGVDDISEAYNGCDEFMRESWRVANLFENWACARVAFNRLSEIWPCLMEDKFADTCLEALEADYLLKLASFTEVECLAVAKLLNLPLL